MNASSRRPRRWVLFALGLLWMLWAGRAHAVTTSPYGLAAMSRVDDLATLRTDTYAGSSSSYNRKEGVGFPGSPNWDDNGHLDVDEHGDRVLVDLQGPGCVYRMHFTGSGANDGFANMTNHLKVYFDGSSTPAIDATFQYLTAGTNAPWLSPLVGDDSISGAAWLYLPLPFASGIKITTDLPMASDLEPSFYNINYQMFEPDTPVTTWTGTEDSSAVLQQWRNVGLDPKSTAGNATVSGNALIPAGATQTLTNLIGPRSISSIKIRIPGVADQPLPGSNAYAPTDTGRAHRGYSQFTMHLDPNNSGVVLRRRLDYNIADQVADVYVDGALVGRWSTPGSDPINCFRDYAFIIPGSFTAGLGSATIKVQFVSSALDWNEFTYWAYSVVDAREVLSDTLDVDDAASESAHQYTVSGQTWSGMRTLSYPPANQYAALLDDTYLRITWDGSATPAVNAPLGAFFGMGEYGSMAVHGLMTGMGEDGWMYVYFPMPFAKSALVQIKNAGASGISGLEYEIQYKAFTGSFADVGYFYSAAATYDPPGSGDMYFPGSGQVGAGHIVGVTQSTPGLGALEGDERVLIDGAASPAIHGTGTEDFYNGGYYFYHGTFSLPMFGHPAKDTTGSMSMYRELVSDAIAFRRIVQMGIEHGQNNDSTAGPVTLLTHYYFAPVLEAEFNDAFYVGTGTHGYQISSQTWSGSQTFSFEGPGYANTETYAGKAHTGHSTFTMQTNPANQGVILRRLFDQGIASQKAELYVNAGAGWVDVGPIYRAGGNGTLRWREDDYVIPASVTAGASSIQVWIEYLSSSQDWNEFRYQTLSLLPFGCDANSTATVGDGFGQGMVGCAATTGFASRAALCAPGYHVCSSSEWVGNRAGEAPRYDYWTDDNLGYIGPENVCQATMSGSSCNGNPMRVCSAKTDPLGNQCNWANCGLDASSPNEYLGGCIGNTTAGTLCCP